METKMTIKTEMSLVVNKINKRKLLAFATYFLITAITVLENIVVKFPEILEDFLLSIFWTMLGVEVVLYMRDCSSEVSKRNEEKVSKRVQQKIGKIKKELIMFLPIFLLSHFVRQFLVNIIGEPANQIAIEQEFDKITLWSFVSLVIIGPMIEEYIFRLLPSRFIKKKIPYIVITTLVFASIHIVDDPNPFGHIWFYMINSFYYGYRYYKTSDIWVTISMHSLNNLISFLEMMFL